jgi:lipooligosaccharide transport system ATP-binding protein
VRLSLWERIRALKRAGTTVLLTTHYMDEAERLCDRLVILAQGRVVAEGAPQDLIAKTLAPEALELELAEDELHTLGRELDGVRRLRTGRRVILYSEDAARLLDRLRHRRAELGDEHRPVIVRPTNLEDVFLALTGTRLEGGA